MADVRRRQFHSCDPCRKGKRGCDAPNVRNASAFGACTNCKRWKKDCTFTWLSSKRTDSRPNSRPKGGRGRTNASTSAASQSDTPSTESSSGAVLNDGARVSEAYPVDPAGGDMFASMESTFARSSMFPEGAPIQGTGLSDAQPGLFSWNMDIPDSWQISTISGESPAFQQQSTYDPISSSLDGTLDATQQVEDDSNPSSFKVTPPAYRDTSLLQRGLCIASDHTANDYARSTMKRNLIRIYHDSMENALSCWLTEHNCPYSDPISNLLPHKDRPEWGPNWSNRMCIRVCRLDRASSSIRGRALSAEEDKTAARALHLAIIAFASQWTQHAQKGAELDVPAPIAHDERSIRKNAWKEARHALQHSTGIPSFRVVFANIIFSLTQSPLDTGQDESLGQLLDNDGAPMFLEAANRQLFTFRHKFMRLQQHATTVRGLRRGSVESTMTDILHMPNPGPPQVDPILSSEDHRSTLSLMFWLGIMFDTLSAAMYQRPLVVSDEDSQIASASAATLDSPDHADLGSWNIPQNAMRKKEDVWGDFFLRGGIERQQSSQVQVRWPCSYEEAAAVLSEATPVKVLLYRRITQLETLIYRGESPDRLEEAIQKALLVYQHWNSNYQRFMLDCVANHEILPPRIQSWYVILDGHWHLAAMLLADVIERIDQEGLGCEVRRDARHATDLMSTLRIDNALAVAGLARSSLHGQDPVMLRYFHDSLNEVAFLVEPWTVVLVHSFAKAGYICVENLHVSGDNDVLAECLRQNCEFCICALQYLARKSDMAFLVARNLSRSLDLKLGQT
ncbi:hypothetical protein BDW62DRAFT_211716 [Aspergillus aurantiobrunneus]